VSEWGVPVSGLRCEAAHAEDPTECEGPQDAVRVVDRHGDAQTGCVNHASAYLASLEGGRVYPASVPGAAIEVYERAKRRRPFDFMFEPQPD
jgi:hypothetical protein